MTPEGRRGMCLALVAMGTHAQHVDTLKGILRVPVVPSLHPDINGRGEELGDPQHTYENTSIYKGGGNL